MTVFQYSRASLIAVEVGWTSALFYNDAGLFRIRPMFQSVPASTSTSISESGGIG